MLSSSLQKSQACRSTHVNVMSASFCGASIDSLDCLKHIFFWENV